MGFQFWSVLEEVTLAFDDGQSTLNNHGTLCFAEHYFRQLLAWSNTLPSRLLRTNQNPHHVLFLSEVLGLWVSFVFLFCWIHVGFHVLFRLKG